MPTTAIDTERRVHLQLRVQFDAVFVFLQPYFAAQVDWGGASHEHLAYRALKEHFPEMSSQDCFIAVATVKRMVASGVLPV